MDIEEPTVSLTEQMIETLTDLEMAAIGALVDSKLRRQEAVQARLEAGLTKALKAQQVRRVQEKHLGRKYCWKQRKEGF